MNIHEDYTKLTSPHTTTQDYREQAEKIAINAFIEFDAETKNRFFDFFREIYKEKRHTYQSLYKNYEALKTDPSKITKSQMHYLLAAIIKFLPTKVQINMLQLELLDSIQKHKLAITRHFTLTPGVKQAFDIYSKYLAGIYYLGNYPSAWFNGKTYQQQDRQEVIQAVIYVYAKKLTTSVLHFKKDIQIIAKKSKDMRHKLYYFIEFLGVEVVVKTHTYLFDKMYVYDNINIPVFTGNYADLLREYLTIQEEDTIQQAATQKMQEAVLSHDLEVALKHYKNSNTITNIVEISFALQGGAGILKLEIKSWISRLISFDIPSKDIGISVAMICAYITFFGSYSAIYYTVGFFFYSILFLYILYYMWNPTRKEDKIDVEQSNKIEKSYRKEMYTQQYEQLLKDKKEEQKYIVIYDNILDNIESKIIKLLNKSMMGMSGHYPNYILNLYQHVLTEIEALTESDLHNLEISIPKNQAKMMLATLKYVVLCKLQKSYQHFTKTNVFGKQNYLKEYEQCKQKLQVLLQKNLQIPELDEDSIDAKNWLENEIVAINQTNTKTEFAHIAHYLRGVWKSETTQHLTMLPLVFEGAEGILYI